MDHSLKVLLSPSALLEPPILDPVAELQRTLQLFNELGKFTQETLSASPIPSRTTPHATPAPTPRPTASFTSSTPTDSPTKFKNLNDKSLVEALLKLRNKTQGLRKLHSNIIRTRS